MKKIVLVFLIVIIGFLLYWGIHMFKFADGVRQDAQRFGQFEHDSAVSPITVDKEAIKVRNETKVTYPKVVEIHSIGIFQLTEMNLDSSNKYGQGDYFGRVYSFSNDSISIVVDSSSSSEYSSDYTVYLLNRNQGMEIIFWKEHVSRYEPNSNSYIHTVKESIYDFREAPQLILTRTDTTSDYNDRAIEKEFKLDTLEDPVSTYEHWETQLYHSWQMEMEN